MTITYHGQIVTFHDEAQLIRWLAYVLCGDAA